jgi:hypothetical protein
MHPSPSGPSPQALSDRPPTPGWMGNLAGLVWIVLGGYWWATYSGPFRWASEWQMRMWDSYNFWLSNVPAILGLVATLGVLALATGTRIEMVDDERPAPRTPLLQTAQRLPLVALAILAGGLDWAGWEHHKANALGDLRAATPDDLLPGRSAAPAQYLELTGRIDPRMVTSESGSSREVYFALRGGGRDAGAAVPVVVRVPENRAAELVRRDEAAGTATVRGIATHGMKAPVRHYFEEQGVAFTSEPWLLNAGDTPERARTLVKVIVGLTLVMSLGWGIRHYFEMRKMA